MFAAINQAGNFAWLHEIGHAAVKWSAALGDLDPIEHARSLAAARINGYGAATACTSTIAAICMPWHADGTARHGTASR
jgi:hypothetical protein